MSLSNSVVVNISAQTQTVSRAGFGVPLLLVHHTLPGNLVRSYTGIDAVITDFGVNHPAVHMARSVFAQNPRPERVRIGKVTNAAAQSVLIKGFPANTGDADVGRVVSFKILKPDGTVSSISYTIQASDTSALIATAVEALVGTVTGLTSAVVNTDEIAIDVNTVGQHYYFYDFQLCSFKDQTPDLGYSAAIDAIALENDDWYGVAIEHPSEANINAVSANIQARKKIFVTHYQGTPEDYTAYMTTLSAMNRDRTFTMLTTGRNMPEYSGAAVLGDRLPADPGSATWKFKTLNSITADILTQTQIDNLQAVNGNCYTNVGGVDIIHEGVMSDGEFADVIRFIDWLEARIKERVFGLFVNTDKVDYDEAGLDQIANEIFAVLEQGVERRGLRADPAPTVTVPDLDDIDPADRLARHVPNIRFQAELRGAVHKVTINGTLTV